MVSSKHIPKQQWSALVLGGYHIFDTCWIWFSQNKLQKVIIRILKNFKTYTSNEGINIFM